MEGKDKGEQRRAALGPSSLRVPMFSKLSPGTRRTFDVVESSRTCTIF